MYKIFIKHSSITISEHPLPEKHFHTILREPDEIEIQNLLRYKERYLKKPEHMLIRTNNPRQIFKYIKKEFKVLKAAGGAVYNVKGEILLIKRLGMWDLPKGKLEADESVQDGAIREVEEECNVFGLYIEEALKPTYHVYFRERWILKKTHWYRMITRNYEQAKPQTSEDIEEVRWFKPNEIDPDRINTYPAIREVLLPLLRPSADIGENQRGA